MQKRITHKPKTYIMKIEPMEDIVQEDKALELIHDGVVLTKEMMDQIEVSDSDEVVQTTEEELLEKKDEKIENETQAEVTEEESSEAQVFEYIKPVKVQDIIYKYTIDDILSANGEPVEIFLDKLMFKKRDTNVSRFRLEMNKMAWSNVDEVLKAIRKIRLDKHEMKACADIFFEKAVREETFCVLYAYALNSLREYYYSREMNDKEKAFNQAILAPKYNEKGEQIFEAITDDKNSNRGYLFNATLEHIANTINTFKSWKYDSTKMNEDENEQALLTSNDYKEKVFGAFRFAVILGLNQVVNEEIIRLSLEGLIDRGVKDEEAEIMGMILTMCGNELNMLYPTLFETSCKELEKYISIAKDNKVKFNTLSVIDEMVRIKNDGGEKSKYLEPKIKGGDLTCEKREFYGGVAQEKTQYKRGSKGKETKLVERRLKEYKKPEIKDIKKEIVMRNTFDGLQSSGNDKLNESEIKYTYVIIEELHMYTEEDKETTIEDIQNDIKSKKISNSALIGSFLYNSFKDKEVKNIIEFCIYCIKILRLNSKLVNSGLKRASMSLGELELDYPKAKDNFYYACCTLRIKGFISFDDFSKYNVEASYIGEFGRTLDDISKQRLTK